MWSLGIPAALRDGPVGCRELRHNGGRLLSSRKANKQKTGSMASQEDVFPQGRPTLVGDHRYVTSFPLLDFNKQNEG